MICGYLSCWQTEYGRYCMHVCVCIHICVHDGLKGEKPWNHSVINNIA